MRTVKEEDLKPGMIVSSCRTKHIPKLIIRVTKSSYTFQWLAGKSYSATYIKDRETLTLLSDTLCEPQN